MKNQKLLSSLCAAALVFSMALTGCADGTASGPAAESGGGAASSAASSAAEAGVAMTDGYYTTSVSNLPCFLHFNEDGTYYASYFDGGITDAGTYEVLDKAIDYFETYGEDGAVDESSKKTAPQAIVLTSYLGGAVQEIAFDGDRLCDFTMGGMSSHAFMDHDAAFAYDAEEMEPAIAVQTLYFNNDTGMTLTLYHDRSFIDYTGDERVSGVWEPSGDGYTLTADSGEEWTLSIDGGSAVCTRGDTAQELSTGVVEGAEAAVFTSAEPVAVSGVPGMEGPTDAEVSLKAYDDGTAELIAVIFDNEVVVDSGTYELDASGQIPAYIFTFETAGEMAAEPDYASATASSIVLNATYVCTDAPCTAEIGGNTMELALSMEAVLSFTYTLG